MMNRVKVFLPVIKLTSPIQPFFEYKSAGAAGGKAKTRRNRKGPENHGILSGLAAASLFLGGPQVLSERWVVERLVQFLHARASRIGRSSVPFFVPPLLRLEFLFRVGLFV